MTVPSQSYFSLPDLSWMLLILTGLYMLWGATFLPSAIPYAYLGPIGSLVKFLQTEHPSVLMFLVVLSVVCHFVESLFCMQMCGRRNLSQSSRIKWFLSTMVFGGASLYKLSQFKQGVAKKFKE